MRTISPSTRTIGGSPTRRCKSDEPRCTITRSIPSMRSRSGLCRRRADIGVLFTFTRATDADARAAAVRGGAACELRRCARGRRSAPRLRRRPCTRTTARSPSARAVTCTSNAPSSEVYANVAAAPESSAMRALPGASSCSSPSSCVSLKAVFVIARGVPCMSSCAGTSAPSMRALARCETRAARKRSS